MINEILIAIIGLAIVIVSGVAWVAWEPYQKKMRAFRNQDKFIKMQGKEIGRLRMLVHWQDVKINDLTRKRDARGRYLPKNSK